MQRRRRSKAAPPAKQKNPPGSGMATAKIALALQSEK
jgi:hypothetical protein